MLQSNTSPMHYENAGMLDRDGFLEGTITLNNPRDALSFFSRWGTPVASSRHPELVRSISPQTATSAPKNTLSSRYGLAAFPFHTDGAHWRQPPRYLVLYCRDPASGIRETLLSQPLPGADSVEKTILRRSLWRVSGVHKHFVARILDGVNGSEFLRFDWSCMTPVSNQDESREVLSACIDRAPIKRITWQRDRFLLIDNWKLLHGRGPAETVDTSRLHWRILLE